MDSRGSQTNEYFAHSTEGPTTTWEPLDVHLRRVAIGENGMPGARQFADAFGSADWGELLGWWHDLGKFSQDFQRHIGNDQDSEALELNGRVDHSTAGAKHAERHLGTFGRLLAYAIAGHHSGLANYDPSDRDGGRRSTLRYRLSDENTIEPIDDRHAHPHHSLAPLPQLNPTGHRGFCAAFWTRMLFSCLVDSDRLWTEYFYDSTKQHVRQSLYRQLADLREPLDSHLDRFQPDTDVKRIRADILSQCRAAAPRRPGFFSLHVPTGGGKTLSSLSFALRHAIAHGHSRVIYSIPLTTIIEQTADSIRSILGDDSVLEVHGNIDPVWNDPTAAAQRLAAENFDAPLIVTTNVQLFESLFARQPSRCRKLHRIANSVIILDEVQTLPINLLIPTLTALRQLVANYGCTIMLCSATQPAILKRDDFKWGLENVHPVIKDPVALHRQLHRVKVEHVGTLDDDAIVDQLANLDRVLCIVNSRRHAKQLINQLSLVDDQALHLSADMCGAHRSKIVAEIKDHLDQEGPCRVIATPVIEAGVDVDFDFVYRAETGLDSIAQAAGRCNREGKLDCGQVRVFAYDRQQYRSVDTVRKGISAFHQMLDPHRDDLLSPAAIDEYFRLYLWTEGGEDGQKLDQPSPQNPSETVMGCFDSPGDSSFQYQFRTASRLYRLIDNAQVSVLVPHGDGIDLIRELESMDEEFVTPDWLRSFDQNCRRYTVGVFPHSIDTLYENQTLTQRFGRWYLNNPDAYDSRFGINRETTGLNINDMTRY